MTSVADGGRFRLPRVFRQFSRDLQQILDGPAPGSRLALLMLGAALSWWVYVPVHELLHAAGCLLGGGGVERLEIAPLYGGSLLAQIFPFVVAESDYAGRLSGFDTGGNDGIHILTVALPYILAPVGFLLLGRALRQGSPFLFGASTPLLFSPLISVTGDFLELGGILLFRLWPEAGCAYRGLISDDLWRLATEISILRGTPQWSPSIPLFALFSQIVGGLLAWTVFDGSSRFAGQPRE